MNKRWQAFAERFTRRELIRLNNIMIAVVCILSAVGYIFIIK